MADEKITKNKQPDELSLKKLKSVKQWQKMTIFVGVFGLMGVAFLLNRIVTTNSSFSLYPTSGQYKVNDTITTTVYESSSARVNTIKADVNYNSYQLKYLNSSCSAPFTLALTEPPAAGVVHLSCSIPGKSVKGKQPVGTINFKVLPGETSTSLSFASSSLIIKAKDTINIWQGESKGATYTITQ